MTINNCTKVISFMIFGVF